tara:strand:- start:9202 stop:9348 length:147 start_codon:yes stop_codon:yes gene_type:complete
MKILFLNKKVFTEITIRNVATSRVVKMDSYNNIIGKPMMLITTVNKKA